jgi:hypothetical protein
VKKMIQIEKGNGLKKGSMVDYQGQPARVTHVINGPLGHYAVIDTSMTKQVAIKNGRGEIKGYITMYYSQACGWVTIPDAE